VTISSCASVISPPVERAMERRENARHPIIDLLCGEFAHTALLIAHPHSEKSRMSSLMPRLLM
jgi:hypothetical protein